jgi:hypothetical protein
VWAKVVDAACLLPQTRKRVFIVGVRRRRVQGQEDVEKGKSKGEEKFITEGAVEGAVGCAVGSAVGGAGDGVEDEFVFPDLPALGRYVGDILEDGHLFPHVPTMLDYEDRCVGERAGGKKRPRSAMSNNNIDGNGTGGGHLDSFALTDAQWDKVRSSRYDVPLLYSYCTLTFPYLTLTANLNTSNFFPLLSLTSFSVLSPLFP